MRSCDELAIERHAKGGVEDDAQERAAAAQTAAVGHPGIVGENSVDADHGGVCGPAQGLDGGAGDFAGDPVGRVRDLLRGRRRDARVESHGDFHEHEGAVMLNPASEAFVEAASFGLAEADGDLDARGAQSFKTVAGDGGVGIDGGGDDASEAGFDERIGAGRRAAGDVAGLECDVGGATVDTIACVRCGLAQSDDFSVIEEIVLVPALANDLAGAVENDAADGGVGRRDADAAARELEGAAHPERILLGNSHIIFFAFFMRT